MQVPLPLSLLLTAAIAPASGSTRVMVRDFESAGCRERPLFFLVNLATGGGWPVDLSRYDGLADKYLDYVRVCNRKLRDPASQPARSRVSVSARDHES